MILPNCYGTLTFIDGATEPVLSVEWITKMSFMFTTISGFYCYEKVVDFPELLYCDNIKCSIANVEHRWAKAVTKPIICHDNTEWRLDWEQVFNIREIFLRDEMIFIHPQT